MQSLYIKDIFQNNTIDLSIINDKLKNKLKNKYLYVPFIGLINNNEIYKLPKIIFNHSRLFYGDNKLLQIDNNTYIQFEGDCKIMSNKWYIKNIFDIIKRYNTIFNINNIKMYIQIVQNRIYKKNSFMGGFASYNAVEIVLNNEIFNYKNRIFIKYIIAHELLHLYFPSISSKYGTCYNEGLLDYLSVILNFSMKDIHYLTNYKMKKYYYRKMLNSNRNISILQTEKPYLIGYLYGYIMEKKDIHKIINYIQIYIKKKKIYVNSLE